MIIVDGEKNDKKQSADTFVTVVKWVIFDDEVEEVSGFLGDGGINIHAVVGLRDGAETRFEGVTPGFAEKFVAFYVFLEGADDVCTFCN